MCKIRKTQKCQFVPKSEKTSVCVNMCYKNVCMVAYKSATNNYIITKMYLPNLYQNVQNNQYANTYAGSI